MPAIRLGGETTIVDDSAHNAFPGVAVADDGTVLIAYRKATDHATTGDGKIVLRRSADDGASWSAEETLLTSASWDYRTATLTKLTTGTILMAVGVESSAGALVVGNQVVLRSTDDGDTWSTVTPGSMSSTGFEHLTGPACELANGDILLPVFGENTGDSGRTCKVMRSTDDGQTFALLATIASGPTDSRSYNEPGLVQLANGTVYAILRDYPAEDFYVCPSTDNGATWGGRTLLDANMAGGPAPIAVDATTAAWIFRDIPDETSRLAYASGSFASLGKHAYLHTGSTSFNGATYGQMARLRDGRWIAVYGYESSSSNSDVFVRVEPKRTGKGGLLHWDGTEYIARPVERWTGTAHERVSVTRWTGSAWVST